MTHIQDMEYKKEHMHEFDEDGIHNVTGTKYDEKGYDIQGYDAIGYNKYGVDRLGFDMRGKNTQPFYDYDVQEKRNKGKEKKKEVIDEEKERVEKKNITTSSYEKKVTLFEHKLNDLRQTYRHLNNSKNLSFDNKKKMLQDLCLEADKIKKTIAYYQKCSVK